MIKSSKTDLELVEHWSDTALENINRYKDGDRSSLHVPAGEMLRICALAASVLCPPITAAEKKKVDWLPVTDDSPREPNRPLSFDPTLYNHEDWP